VKRIPFLFAFLCLVHCALYITPAAAHFGTETVKPGEKLTHFAQRHHTDEATLRSLNPSLTADGVYPGLRLAVPERHHTGDMENEVCRQLNRQRALHALPRLTVNAALGNLARAKARSFADGGYFDHHSPVHGSPFDALEANGVYYVSAGENIARGCDASGDVMRLWMETGGNRENVLSSAFGRMGVGTAVADDGTVYWVLLLTGK
jgi:uncharacterized protein YkwD